MVIVHVGDQVFVGVWVQVGENVGVPVQVLVDVHVGVWVGVKVGVRVLVQLAVGVKLGVWVGVCVIGNSWNVWRKNITSHVTEDDPSAFNESGGSGIPVSKSEATTP